MATQATLAANAVGELTATIERLERIITDADAAHLALQAAITADGGSALQKFSAGELSGDSEIGKLVTSEETLRKSAHAAKAALPTARAQLENARAQAQHFEVQKHHAAKNYLLIKADVVAHRYGKLARELFSAHDALVAISNALPPNTQLGQTIRMVDEFVTLPRFDLPSLADANSEYLGTMTHAPQAGTIERVQAAWSQALDRVIADPDADVENLPRYRMMTNNNAGDGIPAARPVLARSRYTLTGQSRFMATFCAAVHHAKGWATARWRGQRLFRSGGPLLAGRACSWVVHPIP
jgi:hypothetical protein